MHAARAGVGRIRLALAVVIAPPVLLGSPGPKQMPEDSRLARFTSPLVCETKGCQVLNGHRAPGRGTSAAPRQ